MSTLTDIFGPPIFTYSRKQALADGEQVDVSDTAKEAGIKYPTFLTKAVWDKYVVVPEGVTAQDERGRLWDVVFMTRFAIHTAKESTSLLTVKLYVSNSNGGHPRLTFLKAICGPLDVDDPAPSITIMLPEED